MKRETFLAVTPADCHRHDRLNADRFADGPCLFPKTGSGGKPGSIGYRWIPRLLPRGMTTLMLLAFCFRFSAASGEPDAFALPGVGARPGGMGGAFVGLSDDIESIYYNPAGLGNLVQSGVTAMYQA